VVDIEPGQLWEMYSATEKRWVRVVVARIEDDRVTLRYEGVLEFFTLDMWESKTPSGFGLQRAEPDAYGLQIINPAEYREIHSTRVHCR
jgi:hypothetical protein